MRSAATEARDTWQRAARWLRGVAGLDWLPEQGLVEAAARVTLNAADSISDSGPVMMCSTVAAGKEVKFHLGSLTFVKWEMIRCGSPQYISDTYFPEI